MTATDVQGRVIRRRIAVVATAGSGNSTLARQSAERLVLTCKWMPSPLEVLGELLTQALSDDAWRVIQNDSPS
jgi:nicotinamide riboside kinase